MIDIKAVMEEARLAISKETSDKAKNALVKKLRELNNAENIVKNIKREIADLEASIIDGSFAG